MKEFEELKGKFCDICHNQLFSFHWAKIDGVNTCCVCEFITQPNVKELKKYRRYLKLNLLADKCLGCEAQLYYHHKIYSNEPKYCCRCLIYKERRKNI